MKKISVAIIYTHEVFPEQDCINFKKWLSVDAVICFTPDNEMQGIQYPYIQIETYDVSDKNNQQ